MTISNAASASLEANPFVGEGGAYASVRPAYPDEAVAALCWRPLGRVVG